MKKLLILLAMLLALTACESTAAPNDAQPDANTEPVAADVDAPEENPEKDTYWPDYYEKLRNSPDGKEVTIFADNTFDCDYSDYKEIAYDFYNLRRSVMAPNGWNGFRFAPNCDCSGAAFENGLTGIPIYDGKVPVEIDFLNTEHGDYTDYFANKPMEKSVFFFAESPWQYAQNFIADEISKYDHETYTDKKGRIMQVYFIDGLPKYACYDDFFNLCVWFNLTSEEQIPIVVNMINSIDVSLSSEAKFALFQAERLEQLNKDYLDEKGYPEQGVEGAYDKWHEDIQKAVLETESQVTYLYATILNVDASGAVAFWSDNSSYYRSEWNEFYAPDAKITNTYGKELTVDDLKPGQKIIATIKSDSASPIETNPMCYAVFTIKVLPDEITPDSKLPIGENFRQGPTEDEEVEADNDDYLITE